MIFESRRIGLLAMKPAAEAAPGPDRYEVVELVRTHAARAKVLAKTPVLG